MTIYPNLLKRFFSIPVPKHRPDPAVMSWRGKQGAAAKKVKKLLAQYPSIEVEEDFDQFWVYCDDFDPDEDTDPLYDAHFATYWEEVLEKVEVYVKALTAK